MVAECRAAPDLIATPPTHPLLCRAVASLFAQEVNGLKSCLQVTAIENCGLCSACQKHPLAVLVIAENAAPTWIAVASHAPWQFITRRHVAPCAMLPRLPLHACAWRCFGVFCCGPAVAAESTCMISPLPWRVQEIESQVAQVCVRLKVMHWAATNKVHAVLGCVPALCFGTAHVAAT